MKIQALIFSCLLIALTAKAQHEGHSRLAADTVVTTPTGTKMVLLPVRFVKINDEVAIWSAPLELFVEVANEVRDRSPFPYTFYFGYTNGNLRYLVTESAYEQGGYESNASPFTPSAAKDPTESVVDYLQGEMQQGQR